MNARKYRFLSILLIGVCLFVVPLGAHTAVAQPACDISLPSGDVTGLINAIAQANATGTGTILCLASSGDYVLTLVHSTTLTTPNGLPPLTGSLTIKGNGAQIRRSSAAPHFRIFTVETGGELTVENLTVSGARATNHPNYGGGAFFVLGTGVLNVMNSTLTANVVDPGGAGGGAIWIDFDATVTVVDSVLSYNQGSAIASLGTLSISDTTIANNTAASIGGGLYLRGVVTIDGSSIVDNTAVNFGGGFFIYNGNITISNSTISGNEVTSGPFGYGGAIHNEFGTIEITGTGILDNSALNGGAISNRQNMSVHGSCIVGNSATAVFNDPGAPELDASSNWWGAASGPSGSGPGTGDSVSANVNYASFNTEGCQTSLPGSTSLPATVVVRGYVQWTDTGVDLAAGSTLAINAAGIVTIVASGSGQTPDGEPACSAPAGWPAPGLPCWSLIGRIGSGQPFAVGSVRTIDASESGRLYLGVNDNDHSDNSGLWTAGLDIGVAVTGMLVQHQDIPTLNWIDLPESKTFAGNTVRVAADLQSGSTGTQTVTLRLVQASDSEVFAEATIDLNPGIPSTHELFWDTIDSAWTADGDAAAPYDLRLRVVRSDGFILADTPLTVTVRPRPVILVHGWNSDEHTWDDYISWMIDLNLNWFVYAADNLETSVSNFQTAEWNAVKLEDFIQEKRESLNAHHIDIVGHSMGGLIGRAYLHLEGAFGNAFASDGRPVVTNLITLGTPHLGSPCAEPFGRVGGAYHFTPAYMASFNSRINGLYGTQLSALGGSGIRLPCTEFDTPVYGDGLVPTYSALGLGTTNNNMEAPGAKHTGWLGTLFDHVTSENWLDNFVKLRLSASWNFTPAATLDVPYGPAVRSSAEVMPVTQHYTVVVPAGQTVDRPIVSYGDGGIALLLEPKSNMSVELRDPTNVLIATLDELEMSLSPLPMLDYAGAAAETYTVRFTNSSISDSQIQFVVLEDGLPQALSVDVSADVSSVLVAATIADNSVPVSGATVAVELSLIESSVHIPTITLYDDGAHEDGAPDDGVYAGRYLPHYGGVYTILVTADLPSLSLTRGEIVIFDSANLLENGSFETAGLVSREAADWAGKNLLPGDKRKCSKPAKPLDTHDGDCVFQFKGGTPGIAGRKLSQTIVPSGWGNAGETLEISAWVKGKDLGTGAKTVLKVTYADATKGKLKLAIPDGTYDYTQVTGTLLLEKTVVGVKVDLNAKAVGGKLYADDVRMFVLLPSARQVGGRAPNVPAQVAPTGFRGAN